MPRSKPAYPPAFKAEAVRLVGSSDRSLSHLAQDLGVADQTLRNWVRTRHTPDSHHAWIKQRGQVSEDPS